LTPGLGNLYKNISPSKINIDLFCINIIWGSKLIRQGQDVTWVLGNKMIFGHPANSKYIRIYLDINVWIGSYMIYQTLKYFSLKIIATA